VLLARVYCADDVLLCVQSRLGDRHVFQPHVSMFRPEARRLAAKEAGSAGVRSRLVPAERRGRRRATQRSLHLLLQPVDDNTMRTIRFASRSRRSPVVALRIL
jgi:hypothetical protein